MKVSAILYAVTLAVFTAAVTAELVEKKQAREREVKLWAKAASDGNGSLSQPLSERPQFSPPTA